MEDAFIKISFFCKKSIDYLKDFVYLYLHISFSTRPNKIFQIE